TAPEPPVPTSPEPLPSPPREEGSAYAALRALCRRPPAARERAPGGGGPTPPAIAEVERHVEEVRGLTYRRPVEVDAVTQEELVRRLEGSLHRSFPAGLYRRRSLAWATIGVISPGASIRAEVEEFASGQVVGFYVPTSGQLAYIGSERPTPFQRVVLAHELTHALDDQHFHLERLDRLEARCRDEALGAAIGVVEGSAQYFSILYARRFLSVEEQLGLASEALPAVGDVERFIVELQSWPYVAGMAFVGALAERGGTRAVNAALRRFPVSTEQVIHPERYPNDAPRVVDVPDLSAALGEGWKDLDVMEVGEAWLRIMLGLRIDDATARAAASGWDGGIYRAWSHGRDAAVVLDTVWDRAVDAREFADALRSWIGPGQAAAVTAAGERVRAVFATEPEAVRALTGPG
ncbi:MAG TPA: hypothetical protein VNO17_04690, partial [Actinomycetota bacterium]|nr:hypothetical protein [Actinomycetota bacterium]